MPQLAAPENILIGNEKMLLYGIPKTGKTFLALTAPEPIWFLGIGGSNELKTLYSKQFLAKHGRREVYFDTVKENREERGAMSDNPNGFDLVCDTMDEFLDWDDKEGKAIKTIIVDNATVLEEYMMSKSIAAEYAISGGGDKAVLTREREWGIRKPHDTTWGMAQSLMDKFTRWLFELPYNVIFIAHEHQTFTTPKGSRDKQLIGVEPLFVGKQRTQIANAFDNVWRMSSVGGGRNQQFQTQTVGDEKVTAGSRVGLLEPTERDLNLTEVFEEFAEYPKTIS